MSPSDPAAPAAFPRGVADPHGRRAYIRNEVGGIDALDLDDGAAVWRRESPSLPLMALEDGVAALTVTRGRPNEFRVDVLDAGTGHARLTSDPITLPDWASVKDPSAFDIAVRRDGSTLRLTWHARARYGGGAHAPAHIVQAATKDATGTVIVDLATGRVLDGPPAGDITPAVERRSEPEASGTSVLGQRVYEVTEDTDGTHLRARSAASGELAWERRLSSGPEIPPPLRP